MLQNTCIGKSFTIITAIILLTQADLRSQFHPSQIWEDKYLFGPNNIVLENDHASQIYISELLEFIQDLNSIKKQIDEELKANSDKLKVFQLKSEYFQELAESLEIVNLELNIAMQILHLWQVEFPYDFQMCKLANELSQGNCLELYTTTGIFFVDEFSFSEKVLTVKIDESVFAQFVEESTRWEKTQNNENCISAVPEDCMTWELITIPEGYEIVNLTGIKYNVDICPKGGFYEEEEGVCKILTNESLNIMLEIVDIETNSSLTVESWNVIECDP